MAALAQERQAFGQVAQGDLFDEEGAFRGGTFFSPGENGGGDARTVEAGQTGAGEFGGLEVVAGAEIGEERDQCSVARQVADRVDRGGAHGRSRVLGGGDDRARGRRIGAARESGDHGGLGRHVPGGQLGGKCGGEAGRTRAGDRFNGGLFGCPIWAVQNGDEAGGGAGGLKIEQAAEGAGALVGGRVGIAEEFGEEGDALGRGQLARGREFGFEQADDGGGCRAQCGQCGGVADLTEGGRGGLGGRSVLVAEQGGEGRDRGCGSARGEGLDQAEAGAPRGFAQSVGQHRINGGARGAFEGESGDVGFAGVDQHDFEEVEDTGAGCAGGGQDHAETLTCGLARGDRTVGPTEEGHEARFDRGEFFEVGAGGIEVAVEGDEGRLVAGVVQVLEGQRGDACGGLDGGRGGGGGGSIGGGRRSDRGGRRGGAAGGEEREGSADQDGRGREGRSAHGRSG